jgi:hypothetical protein
MIVRSLYTSEHLRTFRGLLAYCQSAPDFVGSKRELSPNRARQIPIRICRSSLNILFAAHQDLDHNADFRL